MITCTVTPWTISWLGFRYCHLGELISFIQIKGGGRKVMQLDENRGRFKQLKESLFHS